MNLNQILNLPDSFVIKQRLGQGAHANVYQCIIDGRETCIKYLIKNEIEGQEILRHEYKALQNLKGQHLNQNIFNDYISQYDQLLDNLPDFDHAGEFIAQCTPTPIQLVISQKYSYIEFQQLNGAPLNVRQAKLSDQQINNYAVQLLLFLFYLHHQLKLVWGDVGVGNILVNNQSLCFVDFENAAQLNSKKEKPQAPRYAHTFQMNSVEAELQSAGFFIMDLKVRSLLPWDSCLLFERIQTVKQRCLQDAMKYFGSDKLVYYLITGNYMGEEVRPFHDYRAEFKQLQGF